MSTSLLYHAFGLRGYRYATSSYEDGRVTFSIRQPRDQLRCPECGRDAVWAQGSVPRTFRTVPIGCKPTQVQFAVPRVYCFACQSVRQVKVRFADPRKSYTRAFERYALDLSRHMTIKAVAEHLQVSWDTVKDTQAASLQRRFGTPKLGKLKQIAIDEIAIGKGHNYLTVVLDLLSGAVVFVGDGKGAEALVPFWKRLRAARAKVQAVATDLSSAYIRAVRDHLPKAVHVFDHFHVVKLFNDKLSALRRELYHQAEADGDRLAIRVAGAGALTFREWHHRSCRVACRLLDRGISALRDHIKARPIVWANGQAELWRKSGLIEVVEVPIVLSFDYANFADY